MDSTYPMPLNRRVKKLIDGLTYQAVKSGSNWMLQLGKDAAAGEYITVDGVLGHATAAIVGGTDTIVEDTNWVPEGDGGALNALNSKINNFGSWTKISSYSTFAAPSCGFVRISVVPNSNNSNTCGRMIVGDNYYSFAMKAGLTVGMCVPIATGETISHSIPGNCDSINYYFMPLFG